MSRAVRAGSGDRPRMTTGIATIAKGTAVVTRRRAGMRSLAHCRERGAASLSRRWNGAHRTPDDALVVSVVSRDLTFVPFVPRGHVEGETRRCVALKRVALVLGGETARDPKTGRVILVRQYVAVPINECEGNTLTRA